MSLLRQLLLWASQNSWLRTHIPQMGFAQRAVRRFMPGETMESALEAAQQLQDDDVNTIFTYLGENVNNLSEAEQNTIHYLEVLDQISRRHLNAEISVKLTQLGLDLSPDNAFQNFTRLCQKCDELNKFVWIDMESSAYTDLTIDFYEKSRQEFENVGICLQAYLFRTMDDLQKLTRRPAAIRLVKGAYKESEKVAYSNKKGVDLNFLALAKVMLEHSQSNHLRAVFGTHDMKLIEALNSFCEEHEISQNKYEIHMLYGIRSAEQFQLKQKGQCVRTLISYGDAWYSWYLRRLAERPANILFVLKHTFK